MNSVIANEMIKSQKVRLVSENTSEVVSLNTALQKADEQNLDLVQINDAEIPVVKIVDLNKFLYEIKQAEKSNKKAQRQSVTQVKEIQLTSETQENDIKIKVKSVEKFISSGKQVRIVMKMPNRRSNSVTQASIDKLKKICKDIDAELVQDVSIQGNQVICLLKSK